MARGTEQVAQQRVGALWVDARRGFVEHEHREVREHRPCERDALIGLHHARRLQQARPSARLVVVPGAGHNDLHEHPAYRQALAQALAGN